MMPPNRTFKEALDVMFPDRRRTPIESIHRWLYSLGKKIAKKIARRIRQMRKELLVTLLALVISLPFASFPSIIALPSPACWLTSVCLLVGITFTVILIWKAGGDIDKEEKRDRKKELTDTIKKAFQQKEDDTELTGWEDRDNERSQESTKLLKTLRQSLQPIARLETISQKTIDAGLRQNKKAHGQASLLLYFK
jgi:hypothetical protein